MKGLKTATLTEKTFMKNGLPDPAAIGAIKDDIRALYDLLKAPGVSGNLAMWGAGGTLLDSGASTGAWTGWTPTITYAGGTTNPTSATITHARWMSIAKGAWFYLRVAFVKGSGDRAQFNFSLPANRNASYTGTIPFICRHTITAAGAVNGLAYSDDASLIKVTVTIANDGYIAIEGFYEAA